MTKALYLLFIIANLSTILAQQGYISLGNHYEEDEEDLISESSQGDYQAGQGSNSKDSEDEIEMGPEIDATNQDSTDSTSLDEPNIVEISIENQYQTDESNVETISQESTTSTTSDELQYEGNNLVESEINNSEETQEPKERGYGYGASEVEVLFQETRLPYGEFESDEEEEDPQKGSDESEETNPIHEQHVAMDRNEEMISIEQVEEDNFEVIVTEEIRNWNDEGFVIGEENSIDEIQTEVDIRETELSIPQEIQTPASPDNVSLTIEVDFEEAEVAEEETSFEETLANGMEDTNEEEIEQVVEIFEEENTEAEIIIEKTESQKQYLTKDDVIINFSGVTLDFSNWPPIPDVYPVVDSDFSAGSGWNSGGLAPQWIEFILKVPTFIYKLELYPNILTGEDSTTTYAEVYFEFTKDSGSTQTLSLTKYMTSSVLETLEVGFIVSAVTVRTTVSGSWVAWNRVLFKLTP